MKWLRFELVPIAQIEITDDIRARTKLAHVAELAASMRDATGGEPGNAPWVTIGQAGGYEVVAGRDRMAALIMLGATEAWVRVGEFTPIELIRAEIDENARRRNDDRSALLASQSKRLAAAMQAEQATTTVAATQSVKAKARKEVAKANKVKPATVKQAEYREDAKVREEEGRRHGAQGDPATPTTSVTSGHETPPVPPPIETWGMPLDDITSKQIAEIQAALDNADKHLRAAQAAITSLVGGPIRQDIVDRLKDDAHRLAARVRSERPAAKCPHCKGDDAVGPGFVEACLMCRGFEWVTEGQLANDPSELRHPGVYEVNGRFLDLAGAQREWAKGAGGPAPAVLPRGAPSNGDARRAGTTSKPRHIRVYDPGNREVTAADIPDPTDEDAPPEEAAS